MKDSETLRNQDYENLDKILYVTNSCDIEKEWWAKCVLLPAGEFQAIGR